MALCGTGIFASDRLRCRRSQDRRSAPGLSRELYSTYIMETFQPLPQSMRKDIRALHKKAYRDSEQLFILEGEKLVQEALDGGLSIMAVVVHPDASPSALSIADACESQEVGVYQTPLQHFQSLCDTASPQSILAVAEYPRMHIDYTQAIVVLDGVADPGNVGTIIRTADWFGYGGVLLGPGCADRFNPKTLRATMGSAFRVAVEYSSSLPNDIQQHLGGSAVYGAAISASTPISDIVPPARHAVVLGSESHGISSEMQPLLTSEFFIPGGGRAESLNVAVAAGVSLYHFSAALRRA